MSSKAAHKIGIVWFRQDLRLSDNPALKAAIAECEQVVPVFIDDPTDGTISSIGEASRAWLHHALASLAQSLEEHDNELLIRQGDPLTELEALLADTAATAVYWNRAYDPATKTRDSAIKSVLSESVQVISCNGLLLVEPWHLAKGDGSPYRVFTPFWRRLLAMLSEQDLKPLAAPRKGTLERRAKVTAKLAIADLGLLPERDWGESMMSYWAPGEKAAAKQLSRFLKQQVTDYDEQRDIPSVEGTSRLSPSLHTGEISARQVMFAIQSTGADITEKGTGIEAYAREIGWREFATHLIYHFPDTVSEPLDSRFSRFPWAPDNKTTRDKLQRWQRGMTGVPIVDAGMRELYATGWMHNRVRMVVASYLVKNLLIPWQRGEAWFRHTLVDADVASNVMGWQWAAGSGADAAPFFRIFNPVLQGEKFDKAGEYVRHWVPELDSVPNRFIHKPWELPKSDQPADYPSPLVDLKASREEALAAFSTIKLPQQQ